jgi:hypothetical protein
MKRQTVIFLSIFSLIIFPVSLCAQQPAVQKVKDQSITYVLNNIRATYKAQTTNFIVNLFEVSNESGSAQQNETDEVTDNLYIAISEFDEKPQQFLFVIKDIYAPSDIKMIKQSEKMIELSFSYLEKGKKRKVRAGITNGECKILNVE